MEYAVEMNRLIKYESLNDDMRQLIMRNGNSLDIAEQAQREGVRNLRQSGLLKVKSGATSLEEIEAVTNE